MGDTVVYKEFRIGDLFDISTGSLIPSNALREGDVPRISAKSSSNGVIGSYNTVSLDGVRHVQNCITVNFFGSSGGIFYHPGKVSLDMKVHALTIPAHTFNKEEALYICTVLKKVLGGFDYGNQLSSSKLKNNDYRITLPSTPEGEPDFEFMAAYIRKVEAYLEVTGLKDYQLTPEEQHALSGEGVTYGDFKLEELFGKTKRGKRLKSMDRVPGSLPFVTAGEVNTGVSDYIGNSVEVFNANTITIDMFGSAKYRGYRYGADDHIAVVNTSEFSREIVMYICTMIHKVTHNGRYSYARNFYASDADATIITLPSTPTGEPDFEFMKLYITAIQKNVVKNLFVWNEQQEKAMRTVIGSGTEA